LRTSEGDVERWIEKLRTLMWRDAGLLRNADGLRRAKAELTVLQQAMPRGNTRREIEATNLHTVAKVIVQSALGREESRGAHFRTDFPAHADMARHSVLRSGELRFE
jgi:L-aspartate oxidase